VGADSHGAVAVSRGALCSPETFGLDCTSDWSARNVRQENDRLGFDIVCRKKLFRRVRLALLGAFNIRNALAATAILNRVGVSEDDIREGLEQFRGVRRRLQFLAETAGIRIYEDFAHHPTAVRETLHAIRSALHPERIWAIYEPRSATSRRNVFQREITEALAEADCIVMPPLYKPEKIPEGERMDLARLIEDLRALGRAAWKLADVEGIIRQVCDQARAGDVVVILSNGGFGGICQKLPAALENR
jgi:UDP-N-acetylmuramate: L-alanyl-gamma-D-glutamyl-meso-diaminopimelate ligase